MAGKFHNDDRFRRPEIFLSDLLRKSVQGKLRESDEAPPLLHRATVVAVDVIGGRLENPGGNGKMEHANASGKTVSIPATVGPENPRNSVKARIISDGFDQFYNDSNLRVFWPFFPEHISVPIKPGEHVYVMFEDKRMTHGLWIGKVPGHENINFFAGQDSFVGKDDGSLTNMFDDTKNASGDAGAEYKTDAEASESGIKNGKLGDLFDDTPKAG